MKKPTQKLLTAVVPAALVAALASFVNTSQAQTFQTVTNGLVAYYALTSIDTNGASEESIQRRDMTAYHATEAANIVADTHPGIESNYVTALGSGNGGTVLIYQSAGQNHLDRSGDFFPFINQRGATMNLWIKAALPASNDQRIFAECSDNGDNNPFFSFGDNSGNNGGVLMFLRENGTVTDPNGITVNQFSDLTYQTPANYYIDAESTQYTTNIVFNNNWHMFTMTIATNGDIHVFVDGNYDPGNQSTATTDNEGNPAYASSLAVTNTYYNTNAYPISGPGFGLTNGQNPGFYVNWLVPGLDQAGAFTTLGGFDRNGGITPGPSAEYSDLGFWNRVLGTNEIQWVMTNGLAGVPVQPNFIKVVQFYQTMPEVGLNNNILLTWQVLGATNVNITGVGNNVGNSGTATVVASANSTYTFIMTASAPNVSAVTKSITVKVLAGVAPDWRLIQRFDGVYSTTTTPGISANSDGIEDFTGDTQVNPFGGTWFCLKGNYAGNLDRFNVVKVNGNLVLSPKSGYYAGTNTSSIGFDTRGALAYGFLNNYSIQPHQAYTLFLRFSLQNPGSFVPLVGWYSGLDFAFGVTDFGFATGPLGGTTNSAPVNSTGIGPAFKIVACDTTGNLALAPFDLEAANYVGSASGSYYTNGYDYYGATGNFLQTNVTYMVWMDVSNNNTQGVGYGTGTTNTINEPTYGVWLQAQASGVAMTPAVQLFSGYGGDRSYVNYGLNSDFPTNILNKIYASVGTEDFLQAAWAPFFETNNMILLDDFYISKTGYDHTLPRPLAIQSVARAASSATVTWFSFGSMFQTNTYSVQRTYSLNPPVTWTTVASGLASGGDSTSYTDSGVGAAPKAFYRITWP
jgi:hypothetical protein